jgi:hypothetical protein
MSASKLRQIISLDMPSSSCASQAAQVEHKRESTDRPYAAAVKARDLGYPDEGIVVIDEDLGLPGSRSVARSGLARLTAEVALARGGLVLGLEVLRFGRNNAEGTAWLIWLDCRARAAPSCRYPRRRRSAGGLRTANRVLKLRR